MGVGVGDLLALGQPIGFGYAIMRVDYYTQRYQEIPNRVLTMTASQMVTVCVLHFFWVLIDDNCHIPDLSYMIEIHRIIALAWTGIVTTVGACVLQGLALERISATDAALIFSSEPVWGSLFAGWLLNERMSFTTYIGGFFILLACIIGSLTGDGGHGASPSPRNLYPSPTTNLQGLKSRMSDVSLSSDSSLPTRHLFDNGFGRAR
jgi:drug/metabolite transporter (DMT)-like permease